MTKNEVYNFVRSLPLHGNVVHSQDRVPHEDLLPREPRALSCNMLRDLPSLLCWPPGKEGGDDVLPLLVLGEFYPDTNVSRYKGMRRAEGGRKPTTKNRNEPETRQVRGMMIKTREVRGMMMGSAGSPRRVVHGVEGRRDRCIGCSQS